MSFSRLAKVEMQLVMHFCDGRTLLALSRTSHLSHSAASEPFAWACVTPVSLRSHVMDVWTRGRCASVSFSARLTGSLLRFAPVTVEWMESPSASWEDERTGLLDSLATTSRLFGLDASAHRWLRDAELESLLLHPSLARLHFLSFAVSFTRGSAQCLTQLPNLRTLHFTAGSLEAGCTRIIATLPQLTELCINQTAGPMDRECLRALLKCPKLESLIIKGNGADRAVLDLIALGSATAATAGETSSHTSRSPSPSSSALCIASSAPASFARRLRSLTLWDAALSDHASVAEEWSAAYFALSGLQLLRLQECTRRALLVRTVLDRAPPSLTALRLDESPLVAPMCLEHSAETAGAHHTANAIASGWSVLDTDTTSVSVAEAIAPRELNLSMLLTWMERSPASEKQDVTVASTAADALSPSLSAASPSSAASSLAPLPLSHSGPPLLIDLHLPSLSQYQRLQGWSPRLNQRWARARNDAAAFADRTKLSGGGIGSSGCGGGRAYRVQSTVDVIPAPPLFPRVWSLVHAPAYQWDRTNTCVWW